MAKVDLITGFLGSGKTTFIKRYARYLLGRGERLGIIENDYGAISVDRMLLDEELGDECEIEMVVAADEDCYKRRFKTKLISMGMLGFDRVIVEPSGIFDVDEFFDVLHEEPLDRWYEVGNVVAIVDAGLTGDLSEESKYLLASQVAGAGSIVLSKTDGMGSKELEKTIDRLNQLMQQFECDREIMPQQVLKKHWEELTGADFEEIAQGHYVSAGFVKRPFVSLPDSYQSLFYYHLAMGEEQIVSMTEELFSHDDYGEIYRIKGYISSGDHGWIKLNATKKEREIERVEAGQEVLIVIGEKMNRERIGEYICHCSRTKDVTFGQTAHHCRHKGDD